MGSLLTKYFFDWGAIDSCKLAPILVDDFKNYLANTNSFLEDIFL